MSTDNDHGRGSHKRTSRSHAQRLLDRVELAKLLRRGWTHGQIAERLGISALQVHKEWKVIAKRLQEQMVIDARERVAQIREEYAEVKREAWGEWDRSKGLKKRVVEEEALPIRVGTPVPIKGKEPPPPVQPKMQKIRITTTLEDECGDPNYLKIVLQCLDAERALEALDPPKEVNTNANVNVMNWDKLITGVLDQSYVMDSKPLELSNDVEEPDGRD